MKLIQKFKQIALELCKKAVSIQQSLQALLVLGSTATVHRYRSNLRLLNNFFKLLVSLE